MTESYEALAAKVIGDISHHVTHTAMFKQLGSIPTMLASTTYSWTGMNCDLSYL